MIQLEKATSSSRENECVVPAPAVLVPTKCSTPSRLVTIVLKLALNSVDFRLKYSCENAKLDDSRLNAFACR